MLKSNKTILGVIVVLLIVSVLMFAYQNIYLPYKSQAELVNVFVARQDIKPLSEVRADMFDVVKVDKETLFPSLITDISSVEGMRIRGGLLRGEFLTTPRLTEREINKDENLTVEIISSFESNANIGDFVNVYVVLQNRQKNEVEVRRLFPNKEVFSKGDNKRFSVRLTEEELENYYIAQELGKIVVSRVDVFNISEEEADIDLKKEQQNYEAIKEVGSEEVPVVLYKVAEGEDLSSIALRFKTTVETLLQLNEDVEDFVAGVEIFVPAQ